MADVHKVFRRQKPVQSGMWRLASYGMADEVVSCQTLSVLKFIWCVGVSRCNHSRLRGPSSKARERADFPGQRANHEVLVMLPNWY